MYNSFTKTARKLALLISFFNLLGAPSQAMKVVDYLTSGKYVPNYFPSSYFRDPVPLDQEMTFEKLVTTIKEKKITSIEGLLPQLPSNMLNHNYIVMYRSRSLQYADPESPRIISYTPTASFILTFNSGNPKHAGSNSLELIQFRHDQKRFEFREITFQDTNVNISEANPQKCLTCHQAKDRKDVDPRPNWEPYNIWPGAIGSNGSDVNTSFATQYYKYKKFNSDDAFFIADQKNEPQYLNKFANEIADKHPRYKSLGVLNTHASTDLTDHLGVLNSMRVVRLMTESKELVSAIPEAPYFLTYCDVKRKNPEMKKLRAGRPSIYFDYANESDEDKNVDIPDEMHQGPPTTVVISPTSSISQNISEFFEGLGVNTSDWSMDFATRGRFAFYERFGVPSNNSSQFRFAWSKFKELTGSCAEIETAFNSKLRAFTETKSGQAAIAKGKALHKPNIENLLRTCMRCHDSHDMETPFIPFGNKQALKAILASSETLAKKIINRTHPLATKEIQMPPSQKLNPEERVLLIKFIDELAGK